MAMFDGNRWPHDVSKPTVVADEQGTGHFPLVDLDDGTGGHEPRGRLDPDPVVAAISDLPAVHVVRRMPRPKTQLEQDPPGDEREAPRRWRVLERGTSPLLW